MTYKKRKEGELFTPLELKYIEDRKNVPANSRSTIKRRIRKKLLYLSKNSIEKVSDLITENQRYEIALNFFFMLYPSSIDELIKIYSNFKELKNKKLDVIRKWKEPKRLEEEILRYERNPLSIGMLIARMGEPVENKKKFEKDMQKFFAHPKTILGAKFTSDLRYICSSKTTKKIYFRIKRYKKPVEMKILLKKFETKREKEIIDEFFRRGILLDSVFGENKFLEVCNSLIKKGEFTENVKSDWLEYDIEPFNTEGNYLNKKVMLNSACKKMTTKDMEYYSPINLPKFNSKNRLQLIADLTK